MEPLAPSVLPHGIRSRFVPDVNGLSLHILEAGFERAGSEMGGRKLVLLLHGFPELAYSWRKVMLPLAEAGYHVVAPDQRGYGRTTGWDPDYDGDVGSFRLLNIVRDALGLVAALGYRSVAMLVGHDFGSPAAAWAALVRPDIFRSVVLMSAPFGGPPALPESAPAAEAAGPSIHEALAALTPPRKHYQWYYSTRPANGDMWRCREGVNAFLRAYYHIKSADWPGNRPYKLAAWRADELAKLPTYYIMEKDRDMAATVAPFLPPAEAVAACRWLPEEELAVYAGEYRRTGFQGGLNWYRCRTIGRFESELQLYAGRTIDVPSAFIAGAADWGIHQKPGDLERMQTREVATDMRFCRLVEGAGHWVQQEQPAAVSRLLLDFLQQL